MRIIAGEKRSRKIEAPEGQDTRPTADRIKEALFSMLQKKLYDATVLDLYAGSGALSLESLSRGAEKAVLVDKSFKACKVIRQNIAALGYEQRANLLQMEDKQAVTHFASLGVRFDIIFLDPPYRMDMGEMIERLCDTLLEDDGIIICEHDRTTPPETPSNAVLYDRREYGITGLSFYRKKETDNE